MKRFLIVHLFAAVVLLAACNKVEPVNDGTFDEKASENVTATKISSLDGAVPHKTKAGFSESKMQELNPKTAHIAVSESKEGFVDMQLDYLWEYGASQRHMRIEIKDIAYAESEDGFTVSVEEAIPGVVIYNGFAVETAFTVEAGKSGDLQTAYLKLKSEEIILEANDFSDRQLEGDGEWVICCDYTLQGKDVFVNALDGELTITMEEYEDFKGLTFTLAPGESKTLDVVLGGYRGPHGVITIEYGEEKYSLKANEGPFAQEVRQRDKGLERYLTDGFLDIYFYPIYTYTFSAETLAK